MEMKIFKQSQDDDQKLQKMFKYEIHNFLCAFSKAKQNIPTFSTAEDQFIKRYRLKNSGLIESSADSFKQFLKAFKDTQGFYDNWHEHIQTSLESFQFCKDLKKVLREIKKSEKKNLSFFLNEIEFHHGFVRENEQQFKSALQSQKKLCSKCKEQVQKNTIQNAKEKVAVRFSDPFKMYTVQKNPKTRQNYLDPISVVDYEGGQGLGLGVGLEKSYVYDASIAQLKLNRIMSETLKLRQDPVSQIHDMLESKQQAEMNSMNRVKINEMFYDLQSELDNRSFQIQEYIEDVMIFNEKLTNYNPNLTNKYEPYEETEPKIVQKELHYNFNKIIKKIYAKVMELIQRKRDQAISVETQVNFSQDHVIKELQRQKKKLGLELKQCQEDKVYVTTKLKEENSRLGAELEAVNEEKLKLQIMTDSITAERDSVQNQSEKLVKVVEHMKKEISKLKDVIGKSGNKNAEGMNHKKSRQNQGVENSEYQREQKFHKMKQELEALKLRRMDEQNQAAIQEMEREMLQKQEELMKSLSKKKLKKRAKYMAPRRSKVSDSIQSGEQAVAFKEMISRFSKQLPPQERQSTSTYEERSSLKTGSDEHVTNVEGKEFEGSEVQIDGMHKVSKNQIQKESQNNRQTVKVERQKVVGESSMKKKYSKTYTSLKTENSQTGSKFNRTQNRLKDIKASAASHKRVVQVQSSSQKQHTLHTILSSENSHKPEVQAIESVNNDQRFSRKSIKNKPVMESSDQEPNSEYTISIVESDNYLNVFEEICKQIEENRNHVGTQTSQPYAFLMALYEIEIQKRNWNSLILTFDAFRFGYEEFLNQLNMLIGKEERNPIRKLNNFKGSSSVLKKAHNYRFNKENLGLEDIPSRRGIQLMKTQESIVETCEQITKTLQNIKNPPKQPSRKYFLPKNNSSLLKSDSHKQQMNKTSVGFNLPENKQETVKSMHQSTGINSALKSAGVLNCTTMKSLKSTKSFHGKLEDINLFKKKSVNTFKEIEAVDSRYVMTEANQVGSEEQSDDGELEPKIQQLLVSQGKRESRKKLPVLMKKQSILEFPNFGKEDAEQLFFSIESARQFEERLKKCNSMKTTFEKLQKREIHFSTEILAVLAHIHLVEPDHYKKIKNVLTYPAILMTGAKSLNIQSSNGAEDNSTEQNTNVQISLKEGIAYILQLHRKCSKDEKIESAQRGQNNNTKAIGRVRETKSLKASKICGHLNEFKRKMMEIVLAHDYHKRLSQQQS